MLRTLPVVRAGLLAGIVTALSAASVADAQVPLARQQTQIELNGTYARPQGEFLDAVKQGWGGGVGLVKPIGDGLVALRADLNYIGYGKQHQDVAVVLPPYEFPARQTTTNNIVLVTVGPQLMATGGTIRPYVNANAGIARFYTQSSLDDVSSDYFQTTSTQSDNWKFTYGIGGGFYVPFAVMQIPLMLDLGAAYSDNGRTTYLTKNDISVDQSGNAVISKRRTPVQFVAYRLGVSVGF
jgi:hypothetical protein